IDEGSGGARDHPKILDGRCRCATWVEDERGLGINRGRFHRPPPPHRKGAREHQNGYRAGNQPVREPVRERRRMRFRRQRSGGGRLRSLRLSGWSLRSLRLSDWSLRSLRLSRWRFHRRCLPPECGGIGPWRQIDPDRVIRTILSLVVLSELLSHLIGRHTNYGVLTRIEVLRKLEEFYADRAFFESAGRTPNGVLDDVLRSE